MIIPWHSLIQNLYVQFTSIRLQCHLVTLGGNIKHVRLSQHLGTRSLRAFRRLYKPRFCRKRAKMMGRFYMYKPRGDLIARLSDISGLAYDEVLDQLKRERIEFLRANYQGISFKDWEVV